MEKWLTPDLGPKMNKMSQELCLRSESSEAIKDYQKSYPKDSGFLKEDDLRNNNNNSS